MEVRGREKGKAIIGEEEEGREGFVKDNGADAVGCRL